MNLTEIVLSDPTRFVKGKTNSQKKFEKDCLDKINGKKRSRRNSLRHNLYSKNKECHYCKQEMLPPTMGKICKDRDATIDHKIPMTRGGKNEVSNRVGACYDCNTDKGKLTDEEYFAVLAVRAKYKR